MEKFTLNHQIALVYHYNVCYNNCIFGYQLKNIKINSDIMSSLPTRIVLLYTKIGNEFGNNMGMIVLETDNIFKEEVFQHIKQITDTLKITQESVCNKFD